MRFSANYFLLGASNRTTEARDGGALVFLTTCQERVGIGLVVVAVARLEYRIFGVISLCRESI